MEVVEISSYANNMLLPSQHKKSSNNTFIKKPALFIHTSASAAKANEMSKQIPHVTCMHVHPITKWDLRTSQSIHAVRCSRPVKQLQHMQLPSYRYHCTITSQLIYITILQSMCTLAVIPIQLNLSTYAWGGRGCVVPTIFLHMC